MKNFNIYIYSFIANGLYVFLVFLLCLGLPAFLLTLHFAPLLIIGILAPFVFGFLLLKNWFKMISYFWDECKSFGSNYWYDYLMVLFASICGLYFGFISIKFLLS